MNRTSGWVRINLAHALIETHDPANLDPAIDEALQAKQEGKEKVILFNLSGHGHVDMAAYDAYFAGGLEDFEYPAEKVKESLAHLPKVDFAK